MKIRRGKAMFSGLMTMRSGASRISIGNSPISHIAKTGPPGWQGTTFLMSLRRRDSDSPTGVNGGCAGQSVFDQGGGPAGSSNVPTATQTPVSLSCDGFDNCGAGGAAGAGAQPQAASSPKIRSVVKARD